MNIDPSSITSSDARCFVKDVPTNDFKTDENGIISMTIETKLPAGLTAGECTITWSKKGSSIVREY